MYKLHVTCWLYTVYVHVEYIKNTSCRYNHVHVHVTCGVNNLNLVDTIMNMYMLHVGYILYRYMWSI